MIIYIKRKNIILFFIFILILTFFVLFLNQVYFSISAEDNRTIVIDPGHGGMDPGAIGKLGVPEKIINLKLANLLKHKLEQNRYNVVLTRSEDISIHDSKVENRDPSTIKASDLKNRRNIVNKSNPILFLSIHLNCFPQDRYYGAQTFYPPDSPESKRLAEAIQLEFKNLIDKQNSREALAITGKAILRNVKVPSVIVECGFLSNEKEENLLITDEYQEKIAEAIFNGINKYLDY